jgi:ribosome-binding protein aMBF1 (putative translation factor)
MMANLMSQRMVNLNDTPASSIKELDMKLQELKHSVSEVYKYELLTTNQYLKQMELVLEIFQELYQKISD